jgi:heme-degrading monooxygenase HmoA
MWLVGSPLARVVGRLAHDLTKAPDIGALHNVMEAFGWARQHQGEHFDGPLAIVSADTGYEFVGVFESGVRARFWEAWHLPGPVEDEVTLFGVEGCLHWRGADGLWLHRVGQAAEQVVVPGSAASGANTPREIGLAKWADLAGQFVTAIQSGEDTGHPTIADGWRVAAVSDAVRGVTTEFGYRVVFLVRVRPGAEEEFLRAYDAIRWEVARTPGHVMDQVGRSTDDPDQWLITSEWLSEEDFVNWESSAGHRTQAAPMMRHVVARQSLRFALVRETADGASPHAQSGAQR